MINLTSRSLLVTTALLASMAFVLTRPAAARTQIHLLRAGDGAMPQDRLVADGASGFYGTTSTGQRLGHGTIFHLTPRVPPQAGWSYKVLHRFTNPDGRFPLDLVLGKDGSLYGTAQRGGLTPGGKNSEGTVFRLSPPAMGQTEWRFSVLKAFRKRLDGNLLAGSLLGGKDGSLYGITRVGGKYLQGTAYRLSSTDGKTWTLTTIHDFTPSEGGFDDRITGLAGDPNTALYGVGFASGGNCDGDGFNGCGSIYQLQPGAAQTDPWSYHLVYQFQDDADGYLPIGPLTLGSNGTLYGVTQLGGPAKSGEVYSLTPPSPGAPMSAAWTKTVLHAFSGGGDGDGPASGLAIDQDGTLYGNTFTGGVQGAKPCQQGCGTVFKLAPPSGGGAWTYSVSHAFGPLPDGALPINDQPTISGGYLFGLTDGGGVGCDDSGGYPLNCAGTIYRVRK